MRGKKPNFIATRKANATLPKPLKAKQTIVVKPLLVENDYTFRFVIEETTCDILLYQNGTRKRSITGIRKDDLLIGLTGDFQKPKNKSGEVYSANKFKLVIDTMYHSNPQDIVIRSFMIEQIQGNRALGWHSVEQVFSFAQKDLTRLISMLEEN